MLTIQDIKKITNSQIEAQKEIFYTKEDLDKKFSGIQTTVDLIAKNKLNCDKAIPVLNHRIKEVEDWVDKAAPAIGIKFEH